MAEKKQTDAERIKNYLKHLCCTKKEAQELLAYDKAVDRGEKTEYDLTPEKQKVAQKYTKTGTRKTPTTYNFNQRERKPNVTKAGLITELASFLEKNSQFAIENLNIDKPERLISFAIGDKKFELTLTQKRDKK